VEEPDLVDGAGTDLTDRDLKKPDPVDTESQTDNTDNTSTDPLAPVANLAVSASAAGNVVLTWEAAPGRKFNVERASGTGDGLTFAYKDTITNDSNEFKDSEAIAGGTYTYRVVPTTRIDNQRTLGAKRTIEVTVDQIGADATLGEYTADFSPDPV